MLLSGVSVSMPDTVMSIGAAITLLIMEWIDKAEINGSLLPTVWGAGWWCQEVAGESWGSGFLSSACTPNTEPALHHWGPTAWRTATGSPAEDKQARKQDAAGGSQHRVQSSGQWTPPSVGSRPKTGVDQYSGEWIPLFCVLLRKVKGSGTRASQASGSPVMVNQNFK